MSVKNEVKMPVQGNCTKCGYISSQPLCKACVLLEGLNRGLPRLEGRLVTNHTRYDRLMNSFAQKQLPNGMYFFLFTGWESGRVVRQRLVSDFSRDHKSANHISNSTQLWIHTSLFLFQIQDIMNSMTNEAKTEREDKAEIKDNT